MNGTAIFVHPDHVDYPPAWMTRHYGVLAVGWPGVTPRTFPADKSFSCRYRLWIHRNAPSSEEMQKVYDAYRAERLPERRRVQARLHEDMHQPSCTS